jgi:hypothetical protein
VQHELQLRPCDRPRDQTGIDALAVDDSPIAERLYWDEKLAPERCQPVFDARLCAIR